MITGKLCFGYLTITKSNNAAPIASPIFCPSERFIEETSSTVF
jgi:hypothetical protein